MRAQQQTRRIAIYGHQLTPGLQHTTATRCRRPFSTTSHRSSGNDGAEKKEPGAMSRRLAEMSEESLETGGKRARKAVQEAGFSDELRARLEEKLTAASFKEEHRAAFTEVNMPGSAPKETVANALAQPWTGTESLADASLRMLNDASKPMKIKRPALRPGSIRGPPKAIDTGRPASKDTGARLANARDKTSIYSYLKDSSLSQDERDKYRKELKERFSSASRSVPATIRGLESLANERIEDAIARGQFKNLPRGKHIERDHNASNPFLDTTEYFMNKIIQKQEIVPPWIEKQQEVTAAVARFRAQLRATWRRHVARTISSRGGELSDQIQAAEQYARAEIAQVATEKALAALRLSADSAEHTSQISPSGELKAVSEQPVENVDEHQTPVPAHAGLPFRDPSWEATERAYQTLAVQNLNNMTRSYNLMAPELAKKPYYSLARELKSCFAEVAPQVAAEIRDRAMAPKMKRGETIGHTPGGVLDRFSMDTAAHVYDEQKPQYGFKEFWRDLFSKKA